MQDYSLGNISKVGMLWKEITFRCLPTSHNKLRSHNLELIFFTVKF